MTTVDHVQLAIAGVADPNNGREAISGLIVGDGDVIATDGHMLVRVESVNTNAPDAAKVLKNAKADATDVAVSVDPAKLAHLLRSLIDAARISKSKKAPPRESMLRLNMRLSRNPLKALVFDMVLPDGRKSEALLMPLRPEQS